MKLIAHALICFKLVHVFTDVCWYGPPIASTAHVQARCRRRFVAVAVAVSVAVAVAAAAVAVVVVVVVCLFVCLFACLLACLFVCCCCCCRVAHHTNMSYLSFAHSLSFFLIHKKHQKNIFFYRLNIDMLRSNCWNILVPHLATLHIEMDGVIHLWKPLKTNGVTSFIQFSFETQHINGNKRDSK